MGARVLVYVDDSFIRMQPNDNECVLAHRARLNKEENNISQDKDEETIELENGEIITPPPSFPVSWSRRQQRRLSSALALC